MASLKRLAGELLIDHSASPGIPEDLAAQWAAQGVAVAPGSTRLETATYTCRHCGTVVILNPQRTRDRNVCRSCMAVVCDRPTCVLNCQPFDRLIEEVVAGRPLRIDPHTNLLLPKGSL
jgi:hypothetical protein